MCSTGRMSFSGEYPKLHYFDNTLAFGWHGEDPELINLRFTCFLSFSDTGDPITQHTDFVPELIIFNAVKAIHNKRGLSFIDL